MYALLILLCHISPSSQKSTEFLTEFDPAEKWTCTSLSEKLNKCEKEWIKTPKNENLVEWLRKARMKLFEMACLPNNLIFQISIGIVTAATSLIFQSSSLKHNLAIAGLGWVTGSIAWWVVSGYGAFEGSHRFQLYFIIAGLLFSAFSLICRKGLVSCPGDLILLADIFGAFFVTGGILAYNISALVNIEMF